MTRERNCQARISIWAKFFLHVEEQIRIIARRKAKSGGAKHRRNGDLTWPRQPAHPSVAKLGSRMSGSSFNSDCTRKDAPLSGKSTQQERNCINIQSRKAL
jgi:hypothetical protein